MLELGGELDVAEKPLGAEALGQFGLEGLDGDLPVVPAVVGEVDGGQSASAEFAFDAVGGRRGFG